MKRILTLVIYGAIASALTASIIYLLNHYVLKDAALIDDFWKGWLIGSVSMIVIASKKD